MWLEGPVLLQLSTYVQVLIVPQHLHLCMEPGLGSIWSQDVREVFWRLCLPPAGINELAIKQQSINRHSSAAHYMALQAIMSAYMHACSLCVQNTHRPGLTCASACDIGQR